MSSGRANRQKANENHVSLLNSQSRNVPLLRHAFTSAARVLPAAAGRPRNSSTTPTNCRTIASYNLVLMEAELLRDGYQQYLLLTSGILDTI
jgi:hypothetical protein